MREAKSEWSVETLRTHLEAKIDLEVARLTDLVLAERELRRARREDDREAIHKAEEAMNVRIALLNEFRQQSVVEQAKFLPRETYDTALEAWSDWRATVESRLNQAAGTARGVGLSAGVLATVIGFILTLISIAVVYFATHH